MPNMDRLPPPRAGAPTILEQAQARGEPNPVGLTVAQLRESGYDLQNAPDAPPDAVYSADERSPTGFSVRWRRPYLLPMEVFSEEAARFYLAN